MFRAGFLKMWGTICWIFTLFLVLQTSLRSEEVSITGRYFKVRVGGVIYEAVEASSSKGKFKAVLDIRGNQVRDPELLKRVSFVGNICGYFPDPQGRKFRFNNYLQTKILQWKDKFKQAKDMIPKMEVLSLYAFDMGPRLIVEAIKIYLTGGEAAVKSASDIAAAISKEAAVQTLRNMIKNPRVYFVTAIDSLLHSSIEGLAAAERKIAEMKYTDVLDYGKIVETDELYWSAVSQGNGAIRMYEEISGDLFSNLFRLLANAVDQLIKEANYSQEKITAMFLAKALLKNIQAKNVMTAYINEIGKWQRYREDELKILYSLADFDMANSVGTPISRLKSRLLLGVKGVLSSSLRMEEKKEYVTYLFTDWGIMVLDGLLFFRNGELWHLNVEKKEAGFFTDTFLNIRSARNPSERMNMADLTAAENFDNWESYSDKMEIAFMGNDIVSIQGYIYYYGKGAMHPSGGPYAWSYRFGANEPMKVADLLGDDGRLSYLQAGKKCYTQAPNREMLTDRIDENRFLVVHEKGSLAIRGFLDAPEVYRDQTAAFDLPLAIENLLISLNDLYPSWGTIIKNIPDAVDAVSSPDRDILVVQTPSQLYVFDDFNEGRVGKVKLKMALPRNSAIVSIQWIPKDVIEKWSSEINGYKKQ